MNKEAMQKLSSNWLNKKQDLYEAESARIMAEKKLAETNARFQSAVQEEASAWEALCAVTGPLPSPEVKKK